MTNYNEFTPQEVQLIERLRNAPQPKLNPQTFSAIQQRLLQEMDAPSVDPAGDATTTLSGVTKPIIISVIVIVILVVVVTFIAVTQQIGNNNTQNLTPTAAINATNAPIIVIEGPVQTINGNILTIFDVDIWVEPDSPLLAQLTVGKSIRVEGQSQFRDDTLIVVAIHVTVVETVRPNPGVPSGCKGKSDKCSRKSER